MYNNNNIPDWAKKFKTRDVYIRKVGNNYYAYKTRPKWDKVNKKTNTLSPVYIVLHTVE